MPGMYKLSISWIHDGCRRGTGTVVVSLPALCPFFENCSTFRSNWVFRCRQHHCSPELLRRATISQKKYSFRYRYASTTEDVVVAPDPRAVLRVERGFPPFSSTQALVARVLSGPPPAADVLDAAQAMLLLPPAIPQADCGDWTSDAFPQGVLAAANAGEGHAGQLCCSDIKHCPLRSWTWERGQARSVGTTPWLMFMSCVAILDLHSGGEGPVDVHHRHHTNQRWVRVQAAVDDDTLLQVSAGVAFGRPAPFPASWVIDACAMYSELDVLSLQPMHWSSGPWTAPGYSVSGCPGVGSSSGTQARAAQPPAVLRVDDAMLVLPQQHIIKLLQCLLPRVAHSGCCVGTFKFNSGLASHVTASGPQPLRSAYPPSIPSPYHLPSYGRTLAGGNDTLAVLEAVLVTQPSPTIVGSYRHRSCLVLLPGTTGTASAAAGTEACVECQRWHKNSLRNLVRYAKKKANSGIGGAGDGVISDGESSDEDEVQREELMGIDKPYEFHIPHELLKRLRDKKTALESALESEQVRFTELRSVKVVLCTH